MISDTNYGVFNLKIFFFFDQQQNNSNIYYTSINVMKGFVGNNRNYKQPNIAYRHLSIYTSFYLYFSKTRSDEVTTFQTNNFGAVFSSTNTWH